MDKKIGFIGVGNMGSVIAATVCKKVNPAQVYLFNPTISKAEALAHEYGCTVVGSNIELVKTCDILVLGVKPQIIADVIADFMPTLESLQEAGRRFVFVSLAAGVTLDNLEQFLHADAFELPVVRCMPNIPVRVGQGILLLSGNQFVNDADKDDILDMLELGGLCEFVDEEVLTSATAVFSCSPAMTYIYIESIADAGVQIGLERDVAVRYAAQAVLGAATLVLEGKKHTGQLRDELATPAGMTIAGTNEMERLGFRAAVIGGVKAAYNRGKTMGDKANK